MSIFQSPAVQSGVVDTMSSSLTSCALASIGASYVSGPSFFPIHSCVDNSTCTSQPLSVVESAFDLYYNQPKFSGISDDTCYSPQGGETSVNAFLSRNSNVVCGT